MSERQPKTRVRRGKTVMRDPRAVDGVVIHQMATPMPTPRRLVRRATKDAERMGVPADVLAEGRRAALAACHVAAMRSGNVFLTRPLETYLYHGNAFNDRALGLEIEGLYPGLRGDMTTVRRAVRHKVTPLTRTTIRAARDALAWVVEEGREIGMPLRWIWAHRQSSPTRPSDPGEELWQEVVEAFAVPILGLVPQYDAKLFSRSKRSRGWGQTVPREWSPRGVGDYR